MSQCVKCLTPIREGDGFDGIPACATCVGNAKRFADGGIQLPRLPPFPDPFAWMKNCTPEELERIRGMCLETMAVLRRPPPPKRPWWKFWA